MTAIARMRSTMLVLAVGLTGCAEMLPNVGPSTSQVINAANNDGSSFFGRQQPTPAASPIQIVPVTDVVARKLLDERKQRMFSEALATAVPPAALIGAGDTIEVNIWEAPPATLFTSGVSADLRGATSGSRVVTIPEQVVDRDGNVNVPFAGKIAAAGHSIPEIELEVARRLKGKANQPEVLVRRIRNASATVTVVGEVVNSIKVPLTPSGERLLDALAAAGGVRQPVNKMTVQITRGMDFHSLPLQTVIRDPRQNVPLQAGDVVTAIFQSLSFTALGSTSKQEEINFEAQGITLAQALARAGGLNDNTSDARGVFIFRFEPETALEWPRQPVLTTPDGLVPVIYSINLRDPSAFFVMQSFAINDKDVLYVSNSPAAELQKFLNLILSVAYPILTGIQLTR
jgi:polysaccharide biosynthesis/export protein